MSDSMVVSSGVPEVIVGANDPVFKGSDPVVTMPLSNDWNKDIAAMAAASEKPAQPESAQAPVTPPAPAAPTPAAVVPPVAAPAAVPIPDKFKAPDGTLDQSKVLKSYGEAERELKRLQNEKGKQSPAPVVPAQTQPLAPVQTAQPGVLDPFVRQVAQDLINEAALQGYQMPPGAAIATAKVQIALANAKHEADTAATFSKVAQFEEQLQEQARRDELGALAKDHAWILSPEGAGQLQAIRAENPWIPNWSKAVELLIGQRALQGNQSAVTMPTPKGLQQTAPPLPANPAPIAQAPKQLNTQEEILAHLKTLTPDEEAKFWKTSGFQWKDTPKQFKGAF